MSWGMTFVVCTSRDPRYRICRLDRDQSKAPCQKETIGAEHVMERKRFFEHNSHPCFWRGRFTLFRIREGDNMGRRKRTPRVDEEHARLMLADELGVAFEHHDDGSKPRMPDLLSVDGNHVAEVITTTPAVIREAEKRLRSVENPGLPHCVRVMIPYAVLGGISQVVRSAIVADVARWTATADHVSHWTDGDDWLALRGSFVPPILALGRFEHGIQVVCVRACQHLSSEPHRVEWSVMHEPSPRDPWTLIRQSLNLVDDEQHGGVDALAKKLDGFPNKHLVIYPFGPPGNLTAALGSYLVPSDPQDFMPPLLNAPLSDVHLWLLYRYGNSGAPEGLHICSGRWAKFGAAFSRSDHSSPLERFHYRNL
jgi:hypothetical protein